jgi:hypothetical protein
MVLGWITAMSGARSKLRHAHFSQNAAVDSPGIGQAVMMSV